MALPKIDVLFALPKGEKYFTALDLCNGYYLIKLDKESIPKSAFTTVFGRFEFFKVTLWTITRSRLLHPSYMQTVLTQQDLKKSRNAFECLSKAGLKIKLSKYSFLRNTSSI